MSKICDEHCYRTFEVEVLLDFRSRVEVPGSFKKPFKVHTNASDLAIGGILMQEGRQVTFKIKKLLNIERRWPTHVKRNVDSNALPQIVATLLGAKVY